MIRESAPWKAELRRHRRALAKIAATPLPEEFADFRIEKPLRYSAGIMRTLIESRKVTDKMRATTFAVEAFPTQPNRQDVMVRLTMQGDIDIEFDLDSPAPVSMDCWDISSEIMHSGFINWEIDETGHFSAIYVASIRNQAQRLLRIPLATYLDMIDGIVDDRVTFVAAQITDKGRLITTLA